MIYTGPELKKAHATDAGYDLVAPEGVVIPPRGTAFVSTETRISIRPDEVGLVCPRSGLGKRGIGIVNAPGIIDSGYTGRIGVILVNHSDEPYEVQAGERIAQLVIVQLGSQVAFRVESDVFDAAAKSCERGENGFGSTGK